MYIKKSIALTTDGAGAASGTASTLPRVARLVGFRVDDAQFDDNYDVTVTDDDSRTLFTKTGITGAVDALLAIDGMDAAGAAVVDQSAGGPVGKTPFTVTIAGGGAAQTGTVVLYLET